MRQLGFCGKDLTNLTKGLGSIVHFAYPEALLTSENHFSQISRKFVHKDPVHIVCIGLGHGMAPNRTG